jgi:hypothetical protein
MTQTETQAIVTLSLMAAFVDGDKHDRERAEVRRIAEGLAQSDAVHLPTLVQDVLMKRVDLAGTAAALLFPGNVYNFGAGMPAVLAPDTPQRPGTEKGRIRVDLEQQLAQATRARGLQAVVVRAGDFFGAGNGSWLDQVIVKKLPQGRVTWPGALDAPHAWAYLPDLARAFVRVAETAPATAGGRFECLHFAGHTVTGQDWLAALTGVAWEQGWLPAVARCAPAGCPGG